MDATERIATEVPGLDRLLDGGLRARALHLIAGPSGTGKTVLAHQIGARYARAREPVLYLTALVENNRTLVAQASQFAFFDASWVGRLFYYVSLYANIVGGNAGEALEALIREHRPGLVIIDGLHMMKAAAANALEFLRLVNTIQTLGALGGPTFLAIANTPEARPGGGEFALSDGILRLGRERSGPAVYRTIQVEKLRGANPLAGEHVFTISAAGIRVFVRLEAVVRREGLRPHTPGGPQLRFGVPGLDAMLGGGVHPSSTTVLAGVPGSGKTVLGLAFATAGDRSEPGLFVGFHETPDRLLDHATGTGIPLREALEEERVRILWKPSAELLADEVVEEILGLVERHHVRRLVIDGLNDIGVLLGLEARSETFVVALTDVLRSRGTSTLLTQRLDTIFGVEFRLPMPQVFAAIDNIVLLRFVELRAQLHRLVSILKVRDHVYDRGIREFRITERGIDVGEPLSQAEAVLTGLGRRTQPPSGGG
ncbi:MAG TPA: ATPase domain-containing protein [Longimicrobiales bacterium]